MSDDTTAELTELLASASIELLDIAAADLARLGAEIERQRAQRAQLAHDIRSAAQGPRLAAEILAEHGDPKIRGKATAIVRGLDKVLALVGTEAEGEKP